MNLAAFFGGSRGLSNLPRAFQELRKRARESPKTIAKPFLDRKRSFLQNVNILPVKSTFLRVGVSLGVQNQPQEVPRGDKKTTSTVPESSQGDLRQQEASKPGPREFQDESGGPLWSI